jgi:hypothetical protein
MDAPGAREVRGMKGRKEEERAAEQKLFSGVLWLNAKVFGLTLGIVCGLALFLATNWLVMKGGEPVGPHLSLLSQYFIGYRVSFIGSFVGFLYGFALGTITGSFIGWFYNKIADLRR